MSKKLENDCFIRALCRQPTARTPVWIMRQAGRYLPEYLSTRQKAGSFMQLCQSAELACEVTMQPLQRFDLDAAILFSDILTIPDAMGLGLAFKQGHGPIFERSISSQKDIDQLAVIDPNQELQYVMNAVSTIRASLANRLPLIGFSGSPWTLAAYMVEGGSGGKQGFAKAQKMLYSRPDLMHQLLDKLTTAVSDYLNAQIEAGVQAVMIFDSWGGLLDPVSYVEFSQNKMRDVLKKLKRQHEGQKIPVVLFTKGGAKNLSGFVDSGADGIGLDWTVNLSEVKSQVGKQLALQGNLNPNILQTDPKTIEQQVKRVLADFGQVDEGYGHVFNLGHGITPDVEPEHVSALVEAVHQYSPHYH